MIETFVERIRGIGAGDVNMNCSLCKYRTQVLGFERDLGAPQESHHHHVEGIGTDGGHHHHDAMAITTATIMITITSMTTRIDPVKRSNGVAER